MAIVRYIVDDVDTSLTFLETLGFTRGPHGTSFRRRGAGRVSTTGASCAIELFESR